VNLLPRSETARSNFNFNTSVSMPVFDAGVSVANERIGRSTARSAAATLEQTKKDVSADVEVAYFNYVSAIQQVEASRAAVVAADANLRAVTEQFRLGAAGVGVVELVTAQTQFFTANNNLIQSRYNVIQALAQLNQAVGR